MASINQKFKERMEQEIELAEQIVSEEKEIWDLCRDYYKGNQKPEGWGDDDDYFSTNLIFSNINSEMPRLAYSNPKFNTQPKRNLGMDKKELLKQQVRSDLAESLLNYYAEQSEFKEHQKLGVLDAKLSMGVWKVFLNIDKEENDDPEPKTIDGQPVLDDENNPVFEDEEEVIEQKFSVKRVRPEYFLVDPRAGNFLSSASWVAEKIPMPTEDAQERFDDPLIEPDGTFNPLSDDDETDDIDVREWLAGSTDTSEFAITDKINQTIVYEVWDLDNERLFYMVDDKVYDVKDIPKEYQGFDGSPYVTLKFNEIPNKFYPIPDVFPQIPINRSYNMSRTSLNSFRKMMIPKFLANKNAFENETELNKLQSTKTGEVIFASNNAENSIAPLPLPNLPQGIFESMSTDLRDMRLVSGVTNEQLGAPDSGVTATQSSFANQASQSKAQWKLSKARDSFTEIGKKLLKLIQHRMVEGGVKKIAGPAGEFWVDYSSEDITGEFDISVDVGSVSPVDEETERAQLFEALNIIASTPGLIKQYNLPRLAENIVEHIPGLDRTVLLSSNLPAQNQILTVQELIQKIERGETEENVPVPVQAPQQENSQGNQNRNQSGQGGQLGGRGGQQQGQALNQFLQQAQQQAAGGVQGGGRQQ